MKKAIKQKVKTYAEFEALVKKLMKPNLSRVFKLIGVSDQLGHYYLKQAIINPDKKIGKDIEIGLED